MKIIAFTRYTRMAASSRYRFYQYFPYLKENGIDITVAPLLDDAYLSCFYSGQRVSLLNVLTAYAQRILHILKSSRYQLIWIEKEALPWIPAWFESTIMNSGVPYVVDYDDATFHRYDQHGSPIVRSLLGEKIDVVMKRAVLVIAGNKYLAARAQEAGARNVEVLPTVIDLNNYLVVPPPNNSVFTIGWIGSPSTAHYLKGIQPALTTVCGNGKAQLIVVGAGPIILEDLPLKSINWEESTEVHQLNKFDVGIMPLLDTPWEQGKCGFKLIQHMASARPVIGSPVGVNKQIITNGVDGFLARKNDEWVDALTRLQNDKDLRQRMGLMGRKKVEEKYCLQVTASKLVAMLKMAGESGYVRH